MKLYSIEGNSQRLDGGSMFGNVPRAMWSKWIEPDDRHRIPLATRALLVRELNGKNVLFETGIGAFFEPKLKDRFGVQESEHMLLKNLAEHGLSHEDIDAVVLSHLHFDHAGGLLSAYEEGKEPELLFPNARFLVSRECWERANHPHMRDRASFVPPINELLAASGRLEIIDTDRSETLGDDVRFEFSSGHTPGMMMSVIGGEGGIVFCADLVPGTPWVHLPVTMGYDRFPEKIIDEKNGFLQDKLDRNIRLFYTHDSEVAASSLIKDEKGKFRVNEPVAELAG